MVALILRSGYWHALVSINVAADALHPTAQIRANPEWSELRNINSLIKTDY